MSSATLPGVSIDDGPSREPDVPMAMSDKPEKKRRRPALSCEQCRRRKVRCDRNVPCNHCVRSNIATCSYAPTHTPASRSKKTSASVAAHHDEPAHIQPASAASLPSSSELIGPTSWPAPLVGASPSLPGSTVGSASVSDASHSNVDWLVSRVHQLEEKLAAAHISENRDAGPGPGTGVLESKDGCFAVVPKGIVSKTRYFGQSHWMNGAELFPTQIGILNREDLDKSELHNSFNKCKTLARTIKQNRLKPLSSVHLGKLVPARELADQLVEAYLRTFEGVLRVLHVPTFRAEYERYWQNPAGASEYFPIQLQLCMALGATLHDDTFSLRGSATQWIYEAQLWLMLPPEKSRLTIAGIQIMCLVNLAKAVCSVGHDLTWITTGALLRTAMYMGLHRDPKNLSKMSRYRAELRRRLWATVLELNLQSAFDAGGSSLLSSTDYDTRPPANLDDHELTDEPDTEDLSDHPTDVPTQASVQIALLRSHTLRTTLLKHINDMQTPESYSETLRLNSELTKACLTMTQALKVFSTKSDDAVPVVTTFHTSMAEIFLYRCFHALHQPVMVKSIDDPKYYFSRKMCLDSALKVVHMCGLTGVGPDGAPVTTSSLPRGSDFRRLLVNGTGMFRNVPVQSNFGILTALVHHRADQSVSLGYLPSLGDADLRACMQAAHGWMMERLAAGETNMKGCCFSAACLAHHDAMQAGLDNKATAAAITEAMGSTSEQCWELMKERARSEGVNLNDEGESAVDMEGLMNYADAWMGDLMWEDSQAAAWPGLQQGSFDAISPMYTGQFGQF